MLQWYHPKSSTTKTPAIAGVALGEPAIISGWNRVQSAIIYLNDYDCFRRSASVLCIVIVSTIWGRTHYALRDADARIECLLISLKISMRVGLTYCILSNTRPNQITVPRPCICTEACSAALTKQVLDKKRSQYHQESSSLELRLCPPTLLIQVRADLLETIFSSTSGQTKCSRSHFPGIPGIFRKDGNFSVMAYDLVIKYVYFNVQNVACKYYGGGKYRTHVLGESRCRAIYINQQRVS